MYGSCATQLDLPSSDLDAVICGFDRRPEGTMNAPLLQQQKDEQMSTPHRANSQDDMLATPSKALHESQQDSSRPYSPAAAKYITVPALSPSAERVIRLAAELERQPWAVQVKAIPTATVPVVKILADPSRLPGAVASVGGDWMMQQHHHIYAPPPPGSHHAQGGYYAPNKASAFGLGHGSHSQYVHHSPPPWRGADVMNGLFSVDITFEGPEHGGIGSTAYSARFVQEACNETGLPPDRTPVVQTLMVLKELLAQRRLNEPFSGGLSSYALLLLVDAVLKERRAIQQEMVKIERQRMAVAAGDSDVNIARHTSVRLNDSAKNTKTPKSPKSAVATRSTRPEKLSQRSALVLENGKIGKQETVANRSEPDANKIQGHAGKMETSALANKPESAVVKYPESTIVKRTASMTKNASSWACIAKKGTGSVVANKVPSQRSANSSSQPDVKQPKSQPAAKVSTFADAVSNRIKAVANASIQSETHVEGKKQIPQQASKKLEQSQPAFIVLPSNGSTSKSDVKHAIDYDIKKDGSANSAAVESSSSSGSESSFGAPSLFPQGSNDVLEVLCSGETTAGKLLLHFLLFYGRHFDSHTTAVDLSGKHHPDAQNVGKRRHKVHRSPYVPRKGGGSIDPVTGMLTVDPIVVYDPLEGAEENNVARSCFAWSSIRWVFAQSYMTLSSAVERSGTPPATSVGNLGEGESGNREAASTARGDHRSGSAEESRDDMVSPLLELLLSF